VIVSINQPAYLPWLGYFDRIAASDVHVVLDTVQFERNSFTNRNKVRTADGWTWLTVPVKLRGHLDGMTIAEVEIADDHWRRKHWATILQNYRKAPHFAAHAEFFEGVFARPWARLCDLLDATTRYLLRALGIETEIRAASALGVTGRKSELVLNLCRRLGATRYISGVLGRDYLDEAPFRGAGIAVEYQDYAHPRYPQIHGGFEPYMSVIDLLFNAGPGAGRILREGGSARAGAAAPNSQP
jgi:hypothetical protein